MRNDFASLSTNMSTKNQTNLTLSPDNAHTSVHIDLQKSQKEAFKNNYSRFLAIGLHKGCRQMSFVGTVPKLTERNALVQILE